VAESLSKVSIVLPTYNGSRYLRQAIESCLKQSYRNIELIIVDDGSTDETPEIIRSYTDPRITSIRHEKNKGLPRALNTGFSATTGEYLTWTSDDNEYMLTAIEEMVIFLKKNPDADFVYADYWAHYLETGEKELRRLPDHLALHIGNEVGPCFLYTRRVYEMTGNYNPKYELVEDYDYWIRISKKFQMVHYPHPLHIYGEHRRSLKMTRFYSITLFDNLLKYQYRFIRWRELSQSVFIFFRWVLRSSSGTREKTILLVQTYLSVNRLSPSLGMLSMLLLGCLSIKKVLEKLFSRLFLLWELVQFPFQLKRTSSALKTSNHKTNILCIIPYMVLGGSEKVLLNLVKGINSENYSFHVVTTEPADHDWYNQFRSPFQNVIVPFRWVTDEALYQKYFRELIDRLNIRILLISNSLIGYKGLPKLKSTYRGLRAVDILHAEAVWGTQRELMGITTYLDRRICISELLKKFMETRYQQAGLEGESFSGKIRVIRNGIDTEQYKPDPSRRGTFKSEFGIPLDARIVSFIGRFAVEKDPFLFVDVARNILRKSTSDKIKFIMAGDGPEFKTVRSIIDKSGLTDHFLLTGTLGDVYSLLADTNILLVVSKTEGIPMVMIEAMAMKVPIVSLNIGAVSELVQDHVTGYLVNPMDNLIDVFTSKVLDILANKVDVAMVCENARQRAVSEYSLEVMTKKYRSLFEELIA